MSNSEITILFPMETINRELDFQLLLAVRHLQPGRRMIVARSGIIHAMIPFLNGGVYVGKDISPLYPQTSVRHEVAKAHNFKVVHLDEEGAFYAGLPETWTNQLDSRIRISLFEHDDYVCTWGDFQRDYFRKKRPEISDRIVTTGHPRFDLCKPAYREYWRDDVQRIQNDLGNYVLVNTNFAAAIYQDDEGTIFTKKNGYFPDDIVRKNLVVQRWKRQTQMLTFFVEMIHQLSDTYPELTVVVRHHPSEDVRFYRNVLKGLDNVEVRHEGPVVPWILGSLGVIHEGCTTGVESFLADRPVINYRPLPDLVESETLIPNRVGWQCDELEEVVELVGRMSRNELGKTPEEFGELSHRILANLDGEAVSKVGKVIENCAESLEASRGGFDTPGIDRTHRAWAQYELGIIANGLRIELEQKRRQQSLKFYGFSDKLLGPKIQRLEEMLNKSVDWRLYGSSLLVIKPS